MVSKEELLGDLREVANTVEKPMTASLYREYGRHPVSKFYNEFGSWNDAKKQARVNEEIPHPNKIAEEDLLKDLKRVATELRRPPTRDDYDEFGKFSASAIYNRFDSWPEARQKAGITGRPVAHNKIESAILLDELKRLSTDLGHTPRRAELEEHGRYSGSVYERRFDSWNGALERAGLEPVHRHNVEKIDVECAMCGTVEERLESQVKKNKNTFCSKECKGAYESENNTGENHHQYNRVEVECTWCQKTFNEIPSLIEGRKNKFCSYVCMGEWRSVNLRGENSPHWKGGEVEVLCENCGETTSKKRAKVKDDGTDFCSLDCFVEWRTELGLIAGKNHPNWKGGYEPYYGPNWSRQRNRALARDNFTCQVKGCGITQEEHRGQNNGQGLSIHHIVPRREFVNDGGGLDHNSANCLSNLMTLCTRCHSTVENSPDVSLEEIT